MCCCCILDHNQEKNEFFCFVAKMFPSIVLSRRTSIPLPVNDLVKKPRRLTPCIVEERCALDSVDVASFSLGGRRVHFLFHFQIITAKKVPDTGLNQGGKYTFFSDFQIVFIKRFLVVGNIPAWISFERKNQFPCVKSSGSSFFSLLSPKCGHHHEHLIAWPETFNCCVSSEFGPIQIPEKFHFLFGSCNNDSSGRSRFDDDFCIAASAAA